MPARRKHREDSVKALANLRALTAASVRKPGNLVDQNSRKSDLAGVVRKSDVPLEGNVRESYKTRLDAAIGRKVYDARRSFGKKDYIGYRHRWTQDDFARVLGIHRASVAEIEAGRRKLSAAELVMLAEWLNVPITELLP